MSALPATSDSPVSFDELQSAITGVVTSGQVGEAVNVRIHWDLASAETELAEAVTAAATLADAVLGLTETRWMVRRDGAELLLNVLGVDDRGRTALLTASRSVVDQVSLTIFGNHGVARVERAELANVSIRRVGSDRLPIQSLRAALQDFTSCTQN